MYEIVRLFQADDRKPRVIRRGLTLEQAQAHCQDPETSSTTCTSSRGKRRTELCGPWFDSYQQT